LEILASFSVEHYKAWRLNSALAISSKVVRNIDVVPYFSLEDIIDELVSKLYSFVVLNRSIWSASKYL
jgi:hypothetical protein